MFYCALFTFSPSLLCSLVIGVILIKDTVGRGSGKVVCTGMHEREQWGALGVRVQGAKIGLCRFSRDASKPFLFTSVVRGQYAQDQGIKDEGGGVDYQSKRRKKLGNGDMQSFSIGAYFLFS